MILACQITFGLAGNAVEFQLEGWIDSRQIGLTHAFRPASRLLLPTVKGATDLLLVLEGEPVSEAPHGREQKIRLLIDGTPIAQLVVDSPFVRCVRIKRTALRSGSVLELRYPNKLPTQTYDLLGGRRLSIGWRRMRFFSVNRARKPPTIDPRLDVQASLPSCPAGQQAVSVSGLTTASLSELLSSCAVNASTSVMCLTGPRTNCLISIAADLPDDASLVRCSVDGAGALSFSFPRVWVAGSDPEPVRQLVLDRWRAVLPLFGAYARTGRVPGSVVISLGDEAHASGLAFCGKDRETLLIPDPYFLQGFGYEALGRSFREGDPLEFSRRKPVALWRGSSTGYRMAGGVLDLDRVKLCHLARKPDLGAVLDVGLTSLVQLRNEAEAQQLRSLGLMADFVAPERLPEWRFHIDVDGNTNSWPGLFQKLLSGSLVFKVTSAGGWRQWYYDRLVPHENFVPVASDLSDLIEKIKHYREDTVEAKKIADNGRSLALAMTYGAEVARAMSVIEDGIMREHLANSQ